MDQSASDTLQRKISDCLGHTMDVGVRVAAIADYTDGLWPTEATAIEAAVEKRRFEFSTGRMLARELMAELGFAAGPIDRGANRQPVWPAGLVGSITHADGLVVAAVARNSGLRGLGVDLETWDRVTPKLHDRLFTAAERKMRGAPRSCLDNFHSQPGIRG